MTCDQSNGCEREDEHGSSYCRGTLPCMWCDGTGIGMHGDPSSSKCFRCRGKGTFLYGYDDASEPEPEADE